jgi:hypothetical protein
MQGTERLSPIQGGWHVQGTERLSPIQGGWHVQGTERLSPIQKGWQSVQETELKDGDTVLGTELVRQDQQLRVLKGHTNRYGVTDDIGAWISIGSASNRNEYQESSWG